MHAVVVIVAGCALAVTYGGCGGSEQSVERQPSVQPPVQPAAPPESFTNSIGVKLVYIKLGTFLMGSPASEKGRDDDETQHRVTITRGFYLGVHEVTQAQYEAVMGTNPALFKKGGNYPVENVSAGEAEDFCKRLSAKEGRTYRLPTEAEWEYACRAGTTTLFAFGDSDVGLSNYAWHHGNSRGRTHPVGEKKANAWGLYDMHGNVFEWCLDKYGSYPSGDQIDPRGPNSRTWVHVMRGGAWRYVATVCRSAHRTAAQSSVRPGHAYYATLGFRLVCVPVSPVR